MAESDVATQEQQKAPSMDEIVAQQRRRLEEARKAMQAASEDPENRETLDKGKGHDGGGCLRF
jgi:predicted phage gp36 major capsid-like protein